MNEFNIWKFALANDDKVIKTETEIQFNDMINKTIKKTEINYRDYHDIIEVMDHEAKFKQNYLWIWFGKHEYTKLLAILQSDILNTFENIKDILNYREFMMDSNIDDKYYAFEDLGKLIDEVYNLIPKDQKDS